MKKLEKINDNDILFYVDSGCEINNDKNDNLISFIEKCNKYDILYTSTNENEIMWNKRDLVDYLEMNNEKTKNSIQNQAGILFIKKNPKTLEFINEWYKICCNYHMIDDTPSILPNDQTFKEHRHDQSIFSLSLIHI